MFCRQTFGLGYFKWCLARVEHDRVPIFFLVCSKLLTKRHLSSLIGNPVFHLHPIILDILESVGKWKAPKTTILHSYIHNAL